MNTLRTFLFTDNKNGTVIMINAYSIMEACATLPDVTSEKSNNYSLVASLECKPQRHVESTIL